MTSQLPDHPVLLRPLTLVQEGEDEAIVGDPSTGTYIAVPAVGAVVIRALQRGATLGEAAAEAQRHTGEPVDVAAFVDGLGELGFTAEDHTSAHAAVRRTAPIQQRRWLAGLNPRHARPLFSPMAWTLYAAALVFSVACFVARPELFPRPEDLFVLDERGLGLLIVMPLSYLLAAVHEAWHWLAARAAGVAARFGIDRRLYFLVFETDLSQLWTLPRRQRYGPQLAGLAVNATLLAGLLTIQLLDEAGWLRLPAFAARLSAALVFLLVMKTLWQCMVFLRTDLYGVLVTATGCRNLWEVKTLLLRRAFGRLTPAQAEQLAAAHPRDLAVGRWFGWAYLAGMVVAVAYFATFPLPVLVTALGWTTQGLAVGPAHARFWVTAAASVLLYLPWMIVAATWLIERHQQRRARTPRPV